MIEDLRTDYKSDILMPVQQDKRTFNILDSNNNILYENVHIEDNSQYLQVGDEYGSDIINAQNTAINTLARGTGLTFNTYQDYLDAKALGEVPVGSIIYIKEGNSTVITANQVTYNDSNVKLALDTVISRIAQINDDLTSTLVIEFTPTYSASSAGGYFAEFSLESYTQEDISTAKYILIQPNSNHAGILNFNYGVKKRADNKWGIEIYTSAQTPLRAIVFYR